MQTPPANLRLMRAVLPQALEEMTFDPSLGWRFGAFHKAAQVCDGRGETPHASTSAGITEDTAAAGGTTTYCEQVTAAFADMSPAGLARLAHSTGDAWLLHQMEQYLPREFFHHWRGVFRHETSSVPDTASSSSLSGTCPLFSTAPSSSSGMPLPDEFMQWGIGRRVSFVTKQRLSIWSPYRPVLATGLFRLLSGAAFSRCLWQTSDTIWYAALDPSEGTDFFTRRLTLASVLMHVVPVWLNDNSSGSVDSFALLDRQLRAAVERGKRLRRLPPVSFLSTKLGPVPRG
ncbi:MAG: hypothetical protein K0U36_01170 [Alphaproteobacteria bacterium]|nr:hypothetical protein [Alphaproteobacteria bacterium]